MKKFLLFIFSISIVIIHTNAQVPFVVSGGVIRLGMEQEDSGNYKKAISYFKEVPEGDSSYQAAMFEVYNCQVADSAFAGAYTTLKNLSIYPDVERRLYLTDLANLYDYLQKPDSSLMLYDTLMRLYPGDNQPYYEKGIVYFRQKKYDEALRYFEKSAILNPYHFASHYMLGSVYMLQGRLSEAYMALQYALLVTNNTKLAAKTILWLNSLALETDEISNYYKAKDSKYSNAQYDETDQIINAKLALSSDYKLKMALNDNIFRQAQVLMEKLKFDPADTTFTMQYYVPLLTQMYAADQFEGFMLAIFSDFGLSDVDALVKRRKSDVAEVKKIAYAYLDNIRATRTLNYNARKNVREQYFLYSAAEKLTLSAFLKDKEKLVYDEGPVVLYKNFTPIAAGYFNSNNQKQGLWKYYYNTGNISSEELTKNGRIYGDMIGYYTNGAIKKITKIDDNEEWQHIETYDERGFLYNKLRKISKTRSEKIIYARNGAVLSQYEMEGDDMVDGHYTRHYDNGNVSSDFNAKKQKYDGVYKGYYYDGGLEEQITYDNGNKEGEYISYYKNGKLHNKYTYRNDKPDGSYSVYDEYGLPDVTGTFEDGKEEGLETRYDDKGNKFGYIEYKKGVPYSIKFTDASGGIIFEKKDDNGIYNYSTYYYNGNKNATFKLNKDGDEDGLQVGYFLTGSKKYEAEYKDGKKDGHYTEYYKSGKISEECTYKNNELDGYYKYYFYSGELFNEGWYKEGKKQGTWLTYFSNGNLATSAYYSDDDIDGYQNTYDVDGKLIYKVLYNAGVETGVVQYDTTGAVINRMLYDKSSGTFALKKSVNVDEFTCPVKHAWFQGAYEKKYANGIVKEKGYSNNDLKDSVNKSYNSLGAEVISGNYKNGKKEGEWHYHNDLGELTYQEAYHEDKEVGKSIVYAKGKIWTVYNYKDGTLDGEQVFYGGDSTVAGILIFKDDELAGYTWLDKSGNKLPVTPVKNGTADITTYFPNGNKGLVFSFVESNYKGKQLHYYSNGNIAEERNYSYRLLNGPRKKYTSDGKLYYEVTYKNDNLTGHEMYYAQDGTVLEDLTYIDGYLHGNCTFMDTKDHQKKNQTFYYGTLQQAK